ncbi:hypothetical protein ANN_01152 [Periplaneta americana]|uniref:Uncharacterized protein n=1 Tax=Periplaneta americana TaxID=6978 RepID=A0ABQ8TV95_PERAM|nr:hypothetical protein ANN_01152 [Periplaneta americana]
MDLREVGYDGRDWINLAQDRDQWRAYARAAMNLRVPSKSITFEDDDNDDDDDDDDYSVFNSDYSDILKLNQTRAGDWTFVMPHHPVCEVNELILSTSLIMQIPMLRHSLRYVTLSHISRQKYMSGVEWSGVEWSGVEWSGVEWSGVEWSEWEWVRVASIKVIWTVVEWSKVKWSGLERSEMNGNRLEWRV